MKEVECNFLKSKVTYSNSNPYIPSVYSDSLNIKKSLKRNVLSSIKRNSGLGQTGFLKFLPAVNNEKQRDTLLIEEGLSNGEGINNKFTSDITIYEKPKDFQKSDEQTANTTAITTKRQIEKVVTPQWHAPWELSAVISGHIGWIWDLAKCCAGVEGGLKLTLTGHISAIRGLVVSNRHPYLFSAGEDKMVKCWDLEYNKVIRHYHGHLSGVFCLDLHPTLDLLISGGRDSVARVWDIRTKHQIHVLGGHANTVGSIITNSVDPQIITSSYDSTIKLWDLAAGKAMTTLTQHKKAVRHICPNRKEFSFVSCGADNIKKWQTRDGRFLMNFSGHNSVINCTAVNDDGVMVTCGDNGSMMFWDYNSGYSFQQTNTIAQSGSLDAEAGIYAASFDLSGSRLITGEADKSIKIWKENTEATEESHPIDMKSWTKTSLKLKKF